NNVMTPNAKQSLENIRPQQIYDALLVPQITADEIAIMENDYEVVTDSKGHRVEQPDDEISVITKLPHAPRWYLSRNVIFSRSALLPHRQLIFEECGNLVTNARYDDYREVNGVRVPWQTEIWRPVEEYDITLTTLKLQINEPLDDTKFALPQPPGADVVR